MKKVAPLFVATAAILWGMLFIFVRKLSAAGFESMEIVCIRVYGSAVILVVMLLVCNRRLLRVKIKDAWCFVGTGVFSVVFFSYCYFRNVSISSAAFSSILMYTSPIWVTLLSVVCFKEKINKKKLLALLLALTGCILVSGGADGSVQISVQGLLLGLGSGIGYGLYSIFGRFALDKGYEPFTITAFTFLFACMGVIPFVSLSSIIYRLLERPEFLGWAFGIAFFTTCLSFALYTVGLKYMEAGKAAVLATLEPIISAVAGTLLYEESLTVSMIIGILLVLTASVISSARESDGDGKKVAQIQEEDCTKKNTIFFGNNDCK